MVRKCELTGHTYHVFTTKPREAIEGKLLQTRPVREQALARCSLASSLHYTAQRNHCPAPAAAKSCTISAQHPTSRRELLALTAPQLRGGRQDLSATPLGGRERTIDASTAVPVGVAASSSSLAPGSLPDHPFPHLATGGRPGTDGPAPRQQQPARDGGLPARRSPCSRSTRTCRGRQHLPAVAAFPEPYSASPTHRRSSTCHAGGHCRPHSTPRASPPATTSVGEGKAEDPPR